MAPPDSDHIFRLNQGDTPAFTAIYNEFYPAIYYFTRKFVQEREDAEDITAEVFVKLWKLRGNLPDIINIRAFLYVSARNTCIDFLRLMRRQNERQKELLFALMQEQAEGILTEDLKTEVLKFIYLEIEKLPGSCRKVFKMAYLDGLSNSEIAAALNINNQTVRNYKQRAITSLRVALIDKHLLAGALIGICTALSCTIE